MDAAWQSLIEEKNLRDLLVKYTDLRSFRNFVSLACGC